MFAEFILLIVFYATTAVLADTTLFTTFLYRCCIAVIQGSFSVIKKRLLQNDSVGLSTATSRFK